MGDNGSQGRSELSGISSRLSRRGLIIGASAVATARLLSGSGSPVSAEEATMRIDQRASGPYASARQGPREQLIAPPPLPPPPPPVRWRPGQFITHVDVAERRMALTFDDGPSPYNTPLVLQTLARYGIKASFFLIGVNVQSFPALARRIADEGHEIGNHSVHHTPYQSVPLANQIGPNQAIINNITGVTPVAHRAPGLTKGQAILNACAWHGLYEVHTNMVMTDSRSPRPPAWALVNEFKSGLRPGGITLYHDGGNRRPTPDALPGIIDYALSRGYTFVTSTELINSGTPQPARGSYLTAEASFDEPSDEAPYIDLCGYDAQAELVGMLDRDDLSLTATDRSRIVGALADIDDVSRE